MFERAALIHYHEIGLKGRNRSAFERRLQTNIQALIGELTSASAECVSSRLLVRATDVSKLDALCEAIAAVPGVAYVAPVYITSREMHDLKSAALLAIRAVSGWESFAIDARRSNTDFPVSSMELNRILGQHVVDETGARVDLTSPDVTCWVEVVQGDAYVFSRKIPGVGGLPVGTAGKVVALLSAGIDSPVAAWRMMKRGAVVVGVHFSGRPQTNDLSERFVTEIAGALQRYGGLGRVYYVPFGDLQKEISLAAPPDLRVLLYRRLMIRVAEEIAAFENAKALVTGESLGQVASQTLENITAVDEVATLPVLRPLIGNDKLEIIAGARAIGTYALSTQSHEDCCTLFMPRMPATHATVAEVLAGEADLDIPRMTADAVASLTFRDFPCPAYRSPRRLPPGVGPDSRDR
ncbi:MAG: tRNA uracil 4-sulfurtransferase ThiI [Actinomycetota bacterium]|nr:tRNA uracil 4-sulfurtransferase ThiI [Actinomycetota bacterium]